MAPSTSPTIDALLLLVPDYPSTVLTHLRQHPTLASSADQNGYSLLHAAASYNHPSLATALVRDFNVDPNVLDAEGDTALYGVEDADMARLLVEELGVDPEHRNEEGTTAREWVESEDEFPAVAAYLKGRESAANGSSGADAVSAAVPPRLPEGVSVQFDNAPADGDGDGGAPDPEFRRRIEELAARDDFMGQDGQRQLKELVQDAVADLRHDDDGNNGRQEGATRRRLE